MKSRGPSNPNSSPSQTSIERSIPRRGRDDRWNVNSVAVELGVSPFTVGLYIRERRIPFYKIGRRIVFDACEIREWFTSRRVAAEN